MKQCAFILAALLAVFVGCTTYEYDGGKIVEGTDAFVGVRVPTTSGATRFEFLNYLSGARFSFDKGVNVEFSYTVTNTVSFFGYSSETVKSMSATLNAADTNDVSCISVAVEEEAK